MMTRIRVAVLVFIAGFIQPITAQIHPITIHPSQRVAALRMTPSEYASWKENDGFTNTDTLQALVKDVYRLFNDEFDFIFLVLNEERTPTSLAYLGRQIHASNEITGLGASPWWGPSLFNHAVQYGSAGRLKSLIAVTGKSGSMFGPSLHELMHFWGNRGIRTSGYNRSPGGLVATDEFIPHWGFTGANTPGQLGGFIQDSLVGNVGGKANRYRVARFGHSQNDINTVPYSQFEQYLMGMIPLTEVASFDVFRNLAAYDASSPLYMEFEADTRIRYDHARIISELGTRSPSHLTSQKDFRLLILILGDVPLTEAEWQAYDRQSEALGQPSSDGTPFYNFWEATGGKGTLETGKLNNTIRSNAIFAPPKFRKPSVSGFPSGEIWYNLMGQQVIRCDNFPPAPGRRIGWGER